MKRFLSAVVVLVLTCGVALAQEESGKRRAAEPEVEQPGAETPAPPEARPAAHPPDPDHNRALEPREFRGVIHSLNQIRDGAVALTTTLIIGLSSLMLAALLVFTGAVAPQATARASIAVRDHPLRSFGIGAVALLLGTLLAAATRGVAGIFLLPIFSAAVCIGLAGVCEQIGRGVVHLAGREGNRVAHLLAGCAVFSFVSIIPLLGWFGIFPYYLAVGVGAFFSTLLGGKRPLAAPDYRGA